MVLTEKAEKGESPFPNFTGTENPCPKNKGISNNNVSINSMNINKFISVGSAMIEDKKPLYTQNEIQVVKLQDTRKNDKEVDNDNIQCVKIQYTGKQYTNINSFYNNRTVNIFLDKIYMGIVFELDR